MKKLWAMPQAEVEQFEMNQFIAACGESGKVYYFDCDAGADRDPVTGLATNIVPGYLLLETNGTPGLQDGADNSDTFLSTNTFTACNAKCEAESSGVFQAGYYVPKTYVTGSASDFTVTDASKVVPVMIWRGVSGNEGHATTKLNISSWETAKS